MCYGSRRDLASRKCVVILISSRLVDEALGKAGDYPFRDVEMSGGFLGGKGVAHVSPSRNFKVRLIFISPKQYNCRPYP